MFKPELELCIRTNVGDLLLHECPARVLVRVFKYIPHLWEFTSTKLHIYVVVVVVVVVVSSESVVVAASSSSSSSGSSSSIRVFVRPLIRPDMDPQKGSGLLEQKYVGRNLLKLSYYRHHSSIIPELGNKLAFVLFIWIYIYSGAEFSEITGT